MDGVDGDFRARPAPGGARRPFEAFAASLAATVPATAPPELAHDVFGEADLSGAGGENGRGNVPDVLPDLLQLFFFFFFFLLQGQEGQLFLGSELAPVGLPRPTTMAASSARRGRSFLRRGLYLDYRFGDRGDRFFDLLDYGLSQYRFGLHDLELGFGFEPVLGHSRPGRGLGGLLGLGLALGLYRFPTRSCS